ncbi:MAG TPA: ArsR family transcriptional regulator [Candidatus Woesearchaeota archaeon]|nr:ArsR family transcriptional regulator [Candidatus Woesearchaeota archaeon]
MEFEDLLTRSKWSILKELAKGEKSAVEIAQKTNQSIANITQQLKLLEAYNLVKKTKHDKKKKPGKPRTPYTLNQELVITSILKPGIAEKKILKLREADDCHKCLLNLFFILKPEDHYYLIKFLCNTDMIKKADTIAYLKAAEKAIEIMIITEHIKEVRENYSNMNITGLDGKTKKIISWSHNKEEIEAGLGRREEYFINLVENSKELLDKKGYITELRQKIIEA